MRERVEYLLFGNEQRWNPELVEVELVVLLRTVDENGGIDAMVTTAIQRMKKVRKQASGCHSRLRFRLHENVQPQQPQKTFSSW